MISRLPIPPACLCIGETENQSLMPTIEISSLDDERLEPYRNLRQSRAQRGECLIAEGHLLVERLLASRATVLSVLAGRRRVEQLITTLPSEVPVFSVPDEWIDRLIGFNFHRGVLAHALRPANPTLTELIPASSPRLTVVACDAIQDPTNLGSLFRSCRALGVDAVLLSPQCADP